MTRAGRQLLLTLALLPCLAPPASAAVLFDNWYTSLILDRRVGYLHEVAETDVVGGVKVLRTTLETEFTIQRMGTELGIKSKAVFVEGMEGEPISFESVSKLAANDYTIRGEKRGDDFLVTQESMGQKTTTEVPMTPDVLFPRAIERAIASRGLSPGARLELKTFSPDTARPTRLTVECKEQELVEVEPGKVEKLWRVESVQDVMSGVTLTEWRDATGRVKKSVLPILGLQIVSLLTTRDKALLGPESVELLVKTLVDPEVTLPRPRGITRAVYKLSLRDRSSTAKLTIPEDERQRIIGRDQGGIVLEVRAEKWETPGDTRPLSRPGGAYLHASSVLQTGDAKVQELARKAAANGIPSVVARSINRWVYGAISKKSLSVGLATAAEVARDLPGGCTEHAVLTAALLRARGIPSKAAMGLVYLDGVFGYHMWTEAWDGAWRAIDPAFGQDGTDATHIKLAESALDQGFIDTAVVSLVQVIANLDVRVVEYDLDGRTLQTARVSEVGFIKGGSYENAAFGLRVSPPKGWRVKPAGGKGSKAPLARIEGPGGATGEVEARAVAYDFRLDEWVAKSYPLARIAEQRPTVVSNKPARRYVLDTNGVREGLLAFLDRDTLFTVRVRPLGKREEKAFESLRNSIEIYN